VQEESSTLKVDLVLHIFILLWSIEGGSVYMLRKSFILFVILSLILTAAGIPMTTVSADTPQVTYYVAPAPAGNNSYDGLAPSYNGIHGPFATIQKAQSVVRTVNSNMTGDIYVYFRGGTYTMTDTISFNEQDSGTNNHNIIYQNYPSETPVISGGYTIPNSGWQLHDSSKNIWRRQLPAEAPQQFRELYVNGTRATRARYPNKDSDVTMGSYLQSGTMSSTPPYTFTVPNWYDQVADWSNMSQIEVVSVQNWRHMRMRMSSYTLNGSDAIISFQSPENGSDVVACQPQDNPPHYYENSYDFLDVEGEWYLDTTTSPEYLYYIPRAGENMSTATVVAPKVETLINFAGSSSTVHNIQFIGITMEYSNWTKPSTIGYLSWYAAIQVNDGANYYYVPGALQISYANNITIQSCTIKNTAAHAIMALDDTTDCTFTGNTIIHTGAGGIYLNLYNSTSNHNVISYNTIQSGGEVYTDAEGICLAFSPYTNIQHNEISDYRYTGIGFGAALDYSDTAATNIDVSYNKIHDVMKLHDDGAGIDTSGKIPNTKIHDNYIYNMSLSSYSGGSAIQGIYIDNGSCLKEVYSNVFDNIMNAFKVNWGTCDNTIRDNYYNGNLGSIDPGTTDSPNIETNDTPVVGSNWPPAAQNIMYYAGTGVGPTPTPAATSFVTSVSLSTTTPYNYLDGHLGMQITVGSNPISVESLGRMCISGNSGLHRLSIYDTSGTEIAHTPDVSTSGATPGQFKYADLTSPTTLSAYTTYYVVSQETNYGDYWYSYDNALQTTSVATCDGSVWESGGTWHPGGNPGYSYVPVDFKYTTSGSSSTPTPTATPTPTPTSTSTPTPTPSGGITYGFEDQPNGDNIPLTGKHNEIDFGTGSWSTHTTNWNGFGSKFAVFSQDVPSRQFTIPTGKVLRSIKISCCDACGQSYKISDGVNPDTTGIVPNASPITVTTGWTTAASTITITFGHTWYSGIDDIVYGDPSGSSPTPTPTATPTPTSTATPTPTPVTVDFEDRPSATTALTGVYPTNGINWGSSDWYTEYADGWNHYLYANNFSKTEITRSFTLPAGKVLKSIIAAGDTAGYIKVSQPGNQIQFNLTGSYATYNTGWTSATGSTVTIKILDTRTWGAAGTIIDSLVYGD
jgi:hypothetical protein